jgi:L-arabinose isomerase
MDFVKKLEVWFITGSQHLYGEETLKQVAEDAKKIAEGLNKTGKFQIKIVWKPTVKTPQEIYDMCQEANYSKNCIGLITWMHTFSPAKMWIKGLSSLQKPFVQLHTQANRDIPWSTIDMDFMNLNQTAHGGREFGFIGSRLRLERTVVVGYWKDDEVQEELDVWFRAATAWYDSRNGKIARFGDNMREVAVTEGDKVEAQIKFGYSVNGYAMGDLVKYVDAVTEKEIDELVKIYESDYIVDPKLLEGGGKRQSLLDAAKLEVGMRKFLEDGEFVGFTTTFENLYGLTQLPGLACQRLMEMGYGFGAEGDWKHSALVRAMKVMGYGLKGGTSFMEDYTYHFDNKNMLVLGSHMLEVCPSIADGKPKLEVHPLGIGGKDDPVRMVFNVPEGPAINVSMMDMGSRFRMVVNEVECVKPLEDLPKLPVARAVWKAMPDLKTAAASWIFAGGAHHTGFSQAVTTKHMKIFAEMAGIEIVVIDENTKVDEFKKELKWNDLYFHLAKGI